MYMDKKKDTTKAQEDNVGAFFQTCKVNGNNIERLTAGSTVKEFFQEARKFLTYCWFLLVTYGGNFMGFAMFNPLRNTELFDPIIRLIKRHTG